MKVLLFLCFGLTFSLLLSLGTMVVLLNPPMADILEVGRYLAITGSMAVGCVAVLLLTPALKRLHSLQPVLFLLLGLMLALITVNVIFLSSMMFISEHDFGLVTALVVFAGCLILVCGIALAQALIARMRLINRGLDAAAHGDWGYHIPVQGSDEIAQLAQAFNALAADQQAIAAEKAQIEQARSELLMGISHDLRTPLAAMRAMNEAIIDGVVTDAATVRKYHLDIERDIHYLTHLINDLFELAQMDMGRAELALQRASLHDIIADTVSGFSSRAALRRIQLKVEVTPESEWLVIAPDKIQRVLTNLLDNALKFTPSGGNITLKAVRKHAYVEISVYNSGSHIPAEHLPRLFERFYRVGSPLVLENDAPRSSGLGLAIARSFVEAHGGTIRAESAVERGTTFVFTLPALPST